MLDQSLLTRNRNINRGFRKLEIWQEAIELYVLVRKEIKSQANLPFKTKAQIEDSIQSVSSNIAEGYCRRYLKESIQFSNIALASLGENYSKLFSLVSSGDISKEWFDEYDKLHYSLENKTINFIKGMIKKLQNKDIWHTDYQIAEIIEPFTK